MESYARYLFGQNNLNVLNMDFFSTLPQDSVDAIRCDAMGEMRFVCIHLPSR